MISVLSHPVFRRLFAAQCLALVGAGLLTVALGLLAWDLAGEAAGAVLGLVFTVKMVAYVGLSPVLAALAARLPRRQVLVAADLVRAGVALCLPFVGAIWQIYVLIFVLQTASAAFTPAFQAVIPDVLPDEDDYTQALSLSRLAYDLESLLSPALGGGAATGDQLFGAVRGHGSGLCRLGAAGAGHAPAAPGGRARAALCRAVDPRAAHLPGHATAAGALGAEFCRRRGGGLCAGQYGGAGARGVCRGRGRGGHGAGGLRGRVHGRRPGPAAPLAPLAGPAGDAGGGDGPGRPGRGTAALTSPGWTGLLILWALFGAGYSGILTPAGRLLRRSAHAEDRPAVFTAQFALSHAGWLITYPLMGWAGLALGLWPALGLAAALAAGAVLAALRLWPREDAVLRHSHPDLPADHPHLAGARGRAHAHVFVIDDEHRVWPSHG